jgi:hypothetical protein
VPEDLSSILGDPTLFTNASDITTKEILKRYGDIGTAGGARHQVEMSDTQSPGGRSRDSGRALAPVVTQVDTDPSQAYAWQKESSVRHVQDPSSTIGGSATNQNTPPQHWQAQDLEPPSLPGQRLGTPDSQSDGQRREYRNSGWGRPQNGSVGVTGAD